MISIEFIKASINKLLVVDNNPEETLKKGFKINYWLMILITRDFDEYFSGKLSRVRLFLVTMGRIMTFMSVIRFLLCAIIREVKVDNFC